MCGDSTFIWACSEVEHITLSSKFLSTLTVLCDLVHETVTFSLASFSINAIWKYPLITNIWQRAAFFHMDFWR